MQCLKIYGLESKPTKSKLLKKLTAKFGETRGNYLYDNVIFPESNSWATNDLSFVKWYTESSYKYMDKDEPSMAAVEEYFEVLNRHNAVYKTFRTNDFELTETETLGVNEGFLYHVMKNIFSDERDNITPQQLIERDQVSVRNIMNKSYRDFMDEMNEIIYLLEGEPEQAKYIEIRRAIDNNRALFYENFNNYTNSKIKLKFNIDNILSDELETVQDKVTKDTYYSKDPIEFDMKESAFDSIKLLIASLSKPDELNSMGFRKPVSYSDTFNLIQDKLVEIPPDIDLFIEELSKIAEYKPEIRQLINYLNFGNETYKPSTDPDTLMREQILRTQFVNTFTKYKLKFKIIEAMEDGTIRSFDSNLDKAVNQIVRKWQNSFENKMVTDPTILSALGDMDYLPKSKILELLDINMTYPERAGNDAVQRIKDFLDTAKIKSAGDLFGTKSEVRGALLQLAAQELVDNPEVVELQQYDFENKLIYSVSLDSQVTTMAKEFSYYAGNEEMLREKFPEFFNSPFAKTSKFKEKILNGAKPRVVIVNGMKESGQPGGMPTKNLLEQDLILMRMVTLLKEGGHILLRTADRTREYAIEFENDPAKHKNYVEPLVSSKQLAKAYYLQHMANEIEQIELMDTMDVAFMDRNNDFRIFGYVDKDGKKHKLTYEALKSSKDPQKTAEDFVDAMIENIIAREREMMESFGILEQEGSNYIYLDGIIKEIPYINSVNQLIELYALNSHISLIEQMKMFVGDPAAYKTGDEVFKRASMLNSTKETMRIDDEMNLFISELDHLFGEAQGNNDDFLSTRINTITINDVKSQYNDGSYSKEETDALESIFENEPEYLKPYADEINEADGFAFVTIDEYRRMSIRSAEWTMEDERLYERIFSGEYYDSDSLHRYSMKKYNYAGRLFNTDETNIPAGRKFAFLPLIPGAYRPGSKLEKLHNEMLKNGIQMAFFTSAAKYGFSSPGNGKSYHDFYGDWNFTQNIDVLDYKYLGNQVRIDNTPKFEIGGTQRNKLVKLNFQENGDIRSLREGEGPEIQVALNQAKKDIEELNKMNSEKISRAFDMFMTQMNLNDIHLFLSNPNPETAKEIKKMINALIDKGIQQGFTANDLIAITHLKELPLFDVMKSKQAIESLLNSSFKTKVVDNKRKGDMMPQASSIGQEIISITEEVRDASERHDIKYYRFAKDGKTLLPMEIVVPLPKVLVDYVIATYGNGKTMTEEALDKFNAAIAEDQAAYEADPLNHNTELTKILTYSGFRIPTQDMASIEVARVKRFLMPHMVGVAIVPKQLVTKTGSDFDIDKLNLYIPHYNVNRADDMENAIKVLKRNNLWNNVEALNNLLEMEGYKMHKGKNLNMDYINLVLRRPPQYIESSISKNLHEEYLLQKKSTKGNKEAWSLEYIRPGQEPYSKMSKEQLENAMLQTEIDLIMNPSNHRFLLAPLDDRMKLLARQVRLDKGLDAEGKIELFEAFTAKKNIEKFRSFLSGLAGVGQVAVHSANHPLAQEAGLRMKALHNYFDINVFDQREFVDEFGRTTVADRDYTVEEIEKVSNLILNKLVPKQGYIVTMDKMLQKQEVYRPDDFVNEHLEKLSQYITGIPLDFKVNRDGYQQSIYNTVNEQNFPKTWETRRDEALDMAENIQATIEAKYTSIRAIKDFRMRNKTFNADAIKGYDKNTSDFLRTVYKGLINGDHKYKSDKQAYFVMTKIAIENQLNTIEAERKMAFGMMAKARKFQTLLNFSQIDKNNYTRRIAERLINEAERIFEFQDKAFEKNPQLKSDIDKSKAIEAALVAAKMMRSESYNWAFIAEVFGDANLVSLEGKSFSLKEISGKAAENTSPEFKAIAEKLDAFVQKREEDVVIEMQSNEHGPAGSFQLGLKVDGWDEKATERLMFDVNSTRFTQSPDLLFIHETVHALTSPLIETNPKLYSALNTYMEYINDEVKKMTEVSPDNTSIFGYSLFGGIYGFSNPHELLAELHSNPEFQDILKKIPAMDTKQFANIFEEIMAWIANLFGIQQDSNAYEQLMKVNDAIMAEMTENSKMYLDRAGNKIKQQRKRNEIKDLIGRIGRGEIDENTFSYNSPKDKWIPLGNISNQEGEIVSEILSSMLTSFVDVANDDYMLDMNAITDTANVILMVMRWGVPKDTIMYFMNQPIIIDHLKSTSINRGVAARAFTETLSPENIVKNLLIDYDISILKYDKMIHVIEDKIADSESTFSEANRVTDIYPKLNTKELRDSVKEYSSNEKFDSDYQFMILDIYLEYQRQSKIFQKMVNSTSQDTKTFKNMSLLKMQLELRNEVRDSGMFENYDKMFEKTFMGEHYNNKQDYFETVRPMFLSLNHKYESQLDPLKKIYAEAVVGDQQRLSITNQIENDFINFILSYGENPQINHAKIYNTQFIGPKSTPKVIQYVQEVMRNQGVENAFLDSILPLINYRDQGFDSIKPKHVNMNNEELQDARHAFKELQNNPELETLLEQRFGEKIDLADEIIRFGMVQTGISNSPFNIVKLLPEDYYFKFVKDKIQNALTGHIDISRFTGVTKVLDKNGDVKFKVTKPGEFMMNHPELLFKKSKRLGLPFEVSWDKNWSKFRFNGMPTGPRLAKGAFNLLMYNTANQTPELKWVAEFPIDRKSLEDDSNMLNCKSNR